MNTDTSGQPDARPAEAEVTSSGIRLFPFSAVVNQMHAKEALLLAVVNPSVHGVLFLGEKGTGKTTLVRSLTSLIPGSSVIELPLGSGEEMVLGTVDAEKALSTGRVSVKTGILSRADGHVLYIDEVNLLADHLVDIILDAAATGRYRLEREGVSDSFNARFTLVGSMNPEEGWLRPQLLDRFGLAVHVSALNSASDRAEVFRRAAAFAADPERFLSVYTNDQLAVRRQITDARVRLGQVTVGDDVLQQTIRSIMDLGVHTHRAEIATLEGARARAALNGRDTVLWEDVRFAMPLALQHRLPSMENRQPVTWEVLKQLLEGRKKAADTPRKGWLPTPFYRKKKAARTAASSG